MVTPVTGSLGCPSNGHFSDPQSSSTPCHYVTFKSLGRAGSHCPCSQLCKLNFSAQWWEEAASLYAHWLWHGPKQAGSGLKSDSVSHGPGSLLVCAQRGQNMGTYTILWCQTPSSASFLSPQTRLCHVGDFHPIELCLVKMPPDMLKTQHCASNDQ